MASQHEETELEGRLRSFIGPGDPRTLRERLDQVQAGARPDLSIWYINAPYFTEHGEPHVRGLIKALDRLLPNDMYPGEESPRALEPYEAFLLLSAAWLHDTGMVEGSYWLEEARRHQHTRRRPAGCKDPDCPLLAGLPRKEEESPVVRRCHHCFSMWAINGPLGRDAGLNTEEAGLVGELARAHNYHADMNNVTPDTSFLGVPVRPRFLASLLRLADAMDLAHPRVPDKHPDLFERDREAQFHWDLHHLVADVVPDLQNGNIRVEIMAASEEDAAIVKRYRVRELQEELDSVMRVLAGQGIVFWGGVTEHTSLVGGLRRHVRLKRPPRRGEPLPDGGSRILVVDDEEWPRSVLRDAVRKVGNNVVVDTAASRSEAEEYLASRFYHATVIDVGLEPRDLDQQPSLEHATGLSLLQGAPHPNRGVPAVLVSALPWQPNVLKVLVNLATQVGAIFLEKDLPHKEKFKPLLLDAVKQALARNP